MNAIDPISANAATSITTIDEPVRVEVRETSRQYTTNPNTLSAGW
jgi:hypothetical protein